MVNRFLPINSGKTHAHENPGFWLDRGLRSFRLPPDLRQRPDAVRTHELEKQLRDSLIGPWAPSESYVRAFRRYQAAVRATPGVSAGSICEVDHGLLIGASTGGVLDVSMTTLRPWGLPYIPGSALKGIAKTYAAQMLAPNDACYAPPSASEDDGPPIENAYSVLFGTAGRKGYIIWHDAWMQPPAGENATWQPFRRQVMTNHHPDYYGGQDAWPTDFDDTRPIGFLTAHESFVVSVTGPDQGWVDLALGILTQALETHGVGGKLTGGFGKLVARLTTDREPGRVHETAPSGSRSGTSVAATTVPDVSAEISPRTTITDLIARARLPESWRDARFGNSTTQKLIELFNEHPELATELRVEAGSAIVDTLIKVKGGQKKLDSKTWAQTARAWKDGHDG